MTQAPLPESPAFRWWGERDRIVIVRRAPRPGKRPADTPDASAPGPACEAAA